MLSSPDFSSRSAMRLLLPAAVIVVVLACLPSSPLPHQNLILLPLHEQNGKFYLILVRVECVLIRLKMECATLECGNNQISCYQYSKFTNHKLLGLDSNNKWYAASLSNTVFMSSSSRIIGNFWLFHIAIYTQFCDEPCCIVYCVQNISLSVLILLSDVNV